METAKEPKKLYRIMEFSKVVQIFENRSLYFANPSSWDDPYEKRMKHPCEHELFAQCWSTLGRSDAMWRIYSKNGLGVRIATTPKKFRTVLKDAVNGNRSKFRLKDVSYLNQVDVNTRARSIARKLNDFYDVRKAVDLLYIKREAFSHESEWRATIHSPMEGPLDIKKGISVAVNPHEFIDSILLDPMASDALANALKHYFTDVLGYKGSVLKSVLYKVPSTFEVEHGYISADTL